MALKTVTVPEAMEALFGKAEEVVSAYFQQRTDAPERGTIEIFGERFVLVRAASMSVEFFSLVEELFGRGREDEAAGFARNILYDLAHAIGRSDAKNFHQKMGLEDPIARMSAGPVHFAHTGWASVELTDEGQTTPDENFYLVYNHPSSFESSAWMRAERDPGFPACIMNAGYSSGWCEESFGISLVSSEVLCAARGHETCRFVMAPPNRIADRVQDYIQSQPNLAADMREFQIPDFFSRKRLEDELRLAHAELEVRVGERTEELRRANERLTAEIDERQRIEHRLLRSQKLEALGGLAGGIAHDFNNLLTAVRVYADLLLAGLEDDKPELVKYAKQIADASDRAERLTNKLLVFSQHRAPQPRSLNLVQTVHEMTDMLRRLIGEDVTLVCDAGDTPSLVRIDPGHAEQVIVNLIVNARDAMPSGGTATITVAAVQLADDARARELGTSPGDKVVLSVNDTGIGMDEDTQNRIFDPFFTTKEVGRGTGLGLATVYGIAQQCGAAVRVRSRPGRHV